MLPELPPAPFDDYARFMVAVALLDLVTVALVLVGLAVVSRAALARLREVRDLLVLVKGWATVGAGGRDETRAAAERVTAAVEQVPAATAEKVAEVIKGDSGVLKKG